MITLDYSPSNRKGKLICDPEVFDFIRNNFSVKNENASFINRRMKNLGSSKKVPDRYYMIGQSGMFDFGLYNEIINFLSNSQFTEIEYSEQFKEYLNCGISDFEPKDDLCLKLRDYQKDIVEKCFKTGRGIVLVGTGGGKSLIQASLVANWLDYKPDAKCLIIVPGLGLVSQLYSSFEEYGIDMKKCSTWTGGTKLKLNSIVITNSENFCSQFGNFKELTEYDLVLVDECHKTKNENILTRLLHKIKTPNKFGFTGTLPKNKVDEWKIIGTFGPVVFSKNSKSLRDENYLANVEINILKLVQDVPHRMDYTEELEWLQTNEKRNKIIQKLVGKLNKNVLVLVDRLEYGRTLLSTFEQNLESRQSFFVSGEMPVEEREKIIHSMETNENIVCIAMSSIFSTGINIKNLHYIIFTFGGKSFIRTIQSVGRGLRLHESKSKLVIFDLYDNMKYSMRHVKERKEYYDYEKIPWKESVVNI